MRSTLVLFFLFLSQIVTAQSYLCIGEKASGFDYNRLFKSWSPTEFKAGNKYHVRRPVRNDRLYPSSPNYVVEGPTHVRDKKSKTSLVGHCEKGFSEHGFLKCNYVNSSFKMNNETLRFTYIKEDGYVLNNKTLELFERANIEGLIYIEIGKCHKTL